MKTREISPDTLQHFFIILDALKVWPLLKALINFNENGLAAIFV